ncbi:unnamed protein product [Diatraea saccharalis]|uniref:Uncharacterized protein n=1 Tax=Diatraea saccharalis TaxID=40085 RepID=A0A9N9WKZ1_9NEOP|nr:unnamed protein product [Diatraea saccharalis]
MIKQYLFRPHWSAFVISRNMCKVSSDEVKPSIASLSARYKPTELQKFILVWTKKFKTKNEIPKYVSADLIDRSQSEARIKLSNILIVLTALASFGAIMAGKAAAKRGESVHQMNLDWHKKYQEEYKEKKAVEVDSVK